MRSWPLALLLFAACGEPDPVCGNGKVEPKGYEQCDNGIHNGEVGNNCSETCKSISILIPQINVSWTILKNTGVPGYDRAECDDLGAAKALVQVEGPTPFEETLSCDRKGMVYTRICPTGVDAGTGCPWLEAGEYVATVTLLDAGGDPLTKAVSSEKMDVQPTSLPVALAVNFAKADFLKQDYKGSFDFLLSWGEEGAECASAKPKVTGVTMTLVPDGKTDPVKTMVTPTGNKLDGTAGKCYTPDNTTNYEHGTGLAWGKYGFTVASSDGAYRGTFPIFVGPNKTPPTYALTVPLAK